MSTITIRLEVPKDLSQFRLPLGVSSRLQYLLKKQESATSLTEAEQAEAEGLLKLAESLACLRVRVERSLKRRNRKA